MMERSDAIVHILAEVAGGRSVARVLREDAGLPSSTTFWRWHMEDEDLRDNLACARVNGVEAILEEARDIADTPQIGEIETVSTGENGGTTTRREDMLGHRRLQIDTRLKYAQMMAPRKYGPKVDVTSGGEKLAADDLDPVARASRLAAIFADIARNNQSEGE